MKKLLLCALGVLSLLAVQPAWAIIFARQVWEHTDNTAKTVEILFDMHASYFVGGGGAAIDQKELVLSNQLDVIAPQQQKDILWSAKLYGKNVHVWIEDMQSFVLKKHPSLSFWVQKDGLAYKTCSLQGLSVKCEQAGVPCTNIEFRDAGDYTDIAKEVALYDDGLSLNGYYKLLDAMTKSFHKEARAAGYLFNAQLAHRVAHCDAQHQMVVAGVAHGDALVTALLLMGYRLRHRVDLHPTLHRIMHAAESDLESIVQKTVTLLLKLKTIPEYCAATVYSMNREKIENIMWATAFCVTHPIHIRAIIEQERKEAAANMAAATSSLPSAPAARVDAIALASALVTPALQSRL